MVFSFVHPEVLLLLPVAAAVALWLYRRPPLPPRHAFPPLRLLNAQGVDLARNKPGKMRLPLRLLLLLLCIVAFAAPVRTASGPAAVDVPAGGVLNVLIDNHAAAVPVRGFLRKALRRIDQEAARANVSLRLITLYDHAPMPVQPTGRPYALNFAARPPDAAFAQARIAEAALPANAHVLYLSAGVQTPGLHEALLRLLPATTRTVLPPSLPLLLQAGERSVHVINASGDARAGVVRFFYTASDGTSGSRDVPFVFNAGEKRITIPDPRDVPGPIERIRLLDAEGAAAVVERPPMARRLRAVVIGAADSGRPAALTGRYYLRKAAEAADLDVSAHVAFGDFVRNADVILADDPAFIAPAQLALLEERLRQGAVLITFVGTQTPRLARYPLPVPLQSARASGRLSDGTPPVLDRFADASPLQGLPLRRPIAVRRAAYPHENTTNQEATVWARLSDGRPAITARPIGAGISIAVHVSLDPRASDLPVSEALPDLLRRLTRREVPGVVLPADQVQTSLQLQAMDALSGLLRAPDPAPLPGAAGLYRPFDVEGRAGSVVVRNALAEGVDYAAIPREAATFMMDEGEDGRDYGRPLLSLALLLWVLDRVHGVFPQAMRVLRVWGAAVLIAVLSVGSARAVGAESAATQVRIGYVADAGLQIYLRDLSTALRERTAVDAGPPEAVDVKHDDLRRYPLLALALTSSTRLDEVALERIYAYVRGGGMLWLLAEDDGDGLNAAADAVSRLPELPPPVAVDDRSVLNRTFYRLSFASRRYGSAALCTDDDDALADVAPCVLTDFAPSIDHEARLRLGVNVVMYALTGNYKNDPVHRAGRAR